jgi:Asp-tRNA(Asn)/Glu-tRNA(Gln) amidotransferase C subunit
MSIDTQTAARVAKLARIKVEEGSRRNLPTFWASLNS